MRQSKKREVLYKNIFFGFLVTIIFLVYLIPSFKSANLFPFTNYPMYARPEYFDDTVFFLCNSDERNLATLTYPLSNAAVIIKWLKLYERVYPNAEPNYYLSELEALNRQKFKTPNAKLHFVKYQLDFEKYRQFILETDPVVTKFSRHQFRACNEKTYEL